MDLLVSRMASLRFKEREQLEQCFRMKSGYVLDFTNRTFGEFIRESVARNIYSEDYATRGSSKANRLRAFFKVEPDHVVGSLIADLVEYARTIPDRPSAEDLDACQRFADRLKQSAPIVGSIPSARDGTTFAALSMEARRAIEQNRPETGLDRLHTFVVTLLREVCDKRGIKVTRDEPADSVLGKYVKVLRLNGELQSTMSEQILRYALSTMGAFNHVRNNQSLAHPNEMLNTDEALLIFSHVVAIVTFIQGIERRNDCPKPATAASLNDAAVPF